MCHYRCRLRSSMPKTWEKRILVDSFTQYWTCFPCEQKAFTSASYSNVAWILGYLEVNNIKWRGSLWSNRNIWYKVKWSWRIFLDERTRRFWLTMFNLIYITVNERDALGWMLLWYCYSQKDSWPSKHSILTHTYIHRHIYCLILEIFTGRSVQYLWQR